MSWYFSLQYSAIQKTVLRHNRLWSIAGISQDLARLNEIEMPSIAITRYGATVLVAGGGKFTARFNSQTQADQAKREIIRAVATKFPMVEFQASEIVEGNSFDDIKSSDARTGILDRLNSAKQAFRGYGTTYLPHLATCEECGEYPAEKDKSFKQGDKAQRTILCRTCHEAWKEAKHELSAMLQLAPECRTTLERIYCDYLGTSDKRPKIPRDFENLYSTAESKNSQAEPDPESNNKGERRRMAVWFSDLNNMNKKVRAWLSQDERAQDKDGNNLILATFERVKDVNVEVVSKALRMTFPLEKLGSYLPFRIVVAGGDDLCVVLKEQAIAGFALHLSCAVQEAVCNLDSGHPLSPTWLAMNLKGGPDISTIPYSFGSSFVIASLHTPFKKIHEIGENLMADTKKKTDRCGNGVNWRIMAEEESQSDRLLAFDRPVFIHEPSVRSSAVKAGPLSFEDYLKLRKKFKISSSHRAEITTRLISFQGRERDFETWLSRFDSGERPKDFAGLLADEAEGNPLRDGGALKMKRLATLFELLTLEDPERKQG